MSNTETAAVEFMHRHIAVNDILIMKIISAEKSTYAVCFSKHELFFMSDMESAVGICKKNNCICYYYPEGRELIFHSIKDIEP